MRPRLTHVDLLACSVLSYALGYVTLWLRLKWGC